MAIEIFLFTVSQSPKSIAAQIKQELKKAVLCTVPIATALQSTRPLYSNKILYCFSLVNCGWACQQCLQVMFLVCALSSTLKLSNNPNKLFLRMD